MPEPQDYWLAIRRGVTAPIDWKEQVLAMGAEGSGYESRMKVRATAEVIEQVFTVLGHVLHIEPLIPHETQ